MLAMRSYNSKGIKFISMLDGSIIQMISDMHKRPITKFIYFDDQNLISCSRDKKICFWNITTQQLEKSLQKHQNFVYDIILSSDKQYLFSAGEDKFIAVWYTPEWQLLCKI
jgi:WD40 repeat protein